MDQDIFEAQVGRRSVRIYLPLSFGAGGLFFLAAGWAGDTALAARVGGALWVGLLTLIVSMPVVTARMKARARRGG
jgi:ABC-type Fe3+-siderophore transport system permease subunit